MKASKAILVMLVLTLSAMTTRAQGRKEIYQALEKALVVEMKFRQDQAQAAAAILEAQEAQRQAIWAAPQDADDKEEAEKRHLTAQQADFEEREEKQEKIRALNQECYKKLSGFLSRDQIAQAEYAEFATSLKMQPKTINRR